jgi:hypothetical protein
MTRDQKEYSLSFRCMVRPFTFRIELTETRISALNSAQLFDFMLTRQYGWIKVSRNKGISWFYGDCPRKPSFSLWKLKWFLRNGV